VKTMNPNRKRYLSFVVHRDGSPVTGKQLSTAIWKSLLSLYGEVTVSDTRLYLNEFDEISGMGYLQCNLYRLRHVIAAAALIETINETKVSFEPKKTSGTIKALHQKK